MSWFVGFFPSAVVLEDHTMYSSLQSLTSTRSIEFASGEINSERRQSKTLERYEV